MSDNAHQTSTNPNSLLQVEQLLQKFNIRLNINEDELKYLPTNSPFIVVSKHLFGLIDHLMVLKVLSEKNQQVRVVASEHNWLLDKAEDLAYEVDLSHLHGNILDDLKGFTDIEQLLANNGAMAIFPAKRGNIFRTPEGRVLDKRWQPAVIRMIRELRIPVVPISFNSSENKILSYIKYNTPEYRGAEIWSMFSGKEHVVNVRIGQPIPVKEQDYFANNARLGRYIRARTNALGTVLEVSKFYLPTFKFPEIQEEIAPPIDKALLIKEMDGLRASGGLLFTQNEFEVFIARSAQIPNVLMEIGRLREITFRDVDEGSNKACDVDEYDLYYRQLIIYDKDAQQIAGGYRIGKGDEIFKAYGIKGFYISSLFKIDRGFGPYLAKAAELGRSYIIPEYQKKRLPLFLLWKGILDFLHQNPQYRYLIGPLSISKQYSHASRYLIIEFIKKHYFDHRLARLVKPRKPYKVKPKDIDSDILIQNMDGEIGKLDNFIEEIEPEHFRIPVLMKKYIKQNARIISFNVDPKFSDVLDGLMILDLKEVPTETIDSLTKEK